MREDRGYRKKDQMPNLRGDRTMSKRELHGEDKLLSRFRGWRLGLSIDNDAIARGIISGLLIIFFAMLQTTLFARYKPFGAVPDLMLPLVVAIAMTEHEKWGAIVGLCAAFVIESVGGASITVLSLLYMPVGYICGIAAVNYFRDSFAVRALFTLITSAIRALFTMFILFSTVGGVTLISAFADAIIPEFIASLTFAAIPHFLAKVCLARFTKTRSDRVKS